MEKEEQKNYIKARFEKIVELEEQKKVLIDEAKAGIMEILKGSMPAIVALDEDIKFSVGEINFAALELKESYSCDSGRVIYYEPWLDEPEGVRIQGIQEKGGPCLLQDSFDAIDHIVQGFLINLSQEEANKKDIETESKGGEDD